jgi:tetratricopeptide (TPR) repeat protein
MKFNSAIVLFLLLFNSALCLQAQVNKTPQVEDANEHFSHGNYLMAIPIYKALLKTDLKNNKIKYNLGICYLNSRINREEAITYLEESSKDAKADDDVWFYLAKAYHINNRLDEAIATFEKYKQQKPKRAEEVDRCIGQCKNALAFMRKPSNITFQNLGKDINSEEPDYYPFINKDETFLAFTSRRKENMGGKKVEIDGYRNSDIYMSTLENGGWTKARSISRAVNGNLDEQIVGLRSDGMEMYVYIDHIDKFGDIYVSNRKDLNTEFSKPKIFDEIVNEKFETSGCLSEDGTVLFFARREKMSENSDLYVCRKLPNNKWALAQKLPDIINSKQNEDLPFLSYDGETLYFASDGHNSMGGYDLFKTKWNQKTNTFSKPENLGYPINSTDDDRSICVTQDNSLAYVSAFRPKGFGDLDLYRVKFNDVEPISRIFTGNVFLKDSIASHQPKNYAVSMIVTNAETEYEYTFVPHSKTGRYVMSLPAGKYKLAIYADGYESFEEDLIVSDLGRVDLEKSRNFLLKKK